MSDWNELARKTNQLDKHLPPQNAVKNALSKDFTVKQVEVSVAELKSNGYATSNIGKAFSSSGKESSWHRTNASQITSLNSFKTLEV